MKPKFLDFPTQGISCPVCGDYSNYVGCNEHEGFYPTLEKNDTAIRVPNCEHCYIECPTCKKDRTIVQFLKVFERAIAQSKIKKLVPKTKNIAVKFDSSDKIYGADLKSIKELDFFRTATFDTLELLFCFDVGSQFGIKDVEEKLEKLNLDIPINFSSIRKINDRLSTLLYTLFMLRIAGLGGYEKQIMEAEINKIYERGDKKDILKKLQHFIGAKNEKAN